MKPPKTRDISSDTLNSDGNYQNNKGKNKSIGNLISGFRVSNLFNSKSNESPRSRSQPPNKRGVMRDYVENYEERDDSSPFLTGLKPNQSLFGLNSNNNFKKQQSQLNKHQSFPRNVSFFLFYFKS